uniref:Uncharacterized protein n=1 Tax=Panagrolaimus superbus TaxID=310955 RepID=A0A914XXE5_9BILA
MEYWSIRLRNNHSNPLREDFFDNPHRKALFHFCQDFRIQGYCTSDMLIYRQTKPLEYMGYDPKATLTYPNRKLRQTFMDLKEEAMEPLPKSTEKRVDEMEVLYWKIKECEDNQEEWIKCLQEVDNLKFLKRNVEQRLSFNLCNKKLWKLYINHLKTADPKEMLQVYSKYCRFFMDDEEMLEEYKEAAEEHGPVLVKWKNLFNFETKDSNEEYPENVDREFDDEPLLPYSEYVFEFGKFEAQSQPWSFPSPLIRYIRFGHGNVEKLDLRDSIVKSGDDNDDNLKLVEMLKILPKIRYFE